MSELARKLEVALDASREAAELTLRYFQTTDLDVEAKADGSPVTVADRAAEELLRDRLHRAFPGDGILGEEHGEDPGRTGDRWILDPIDGTFSFARGVPLYTSLVGLEREGEAVLGVVRAPALGEAGFAARGEGAFWERPGHDAVPARVADTTRLDDALLCVTSTDTFEEAGCPDLFPRLLSACAHFRGYPDAYGHLLVATGRADLMVDPIVAIWDCCALQPLIEEAGGVFATLDGRKTHNGGSAWSTTAPLAPEVRRLLNRK